MWRRPSPGIAAEDFEGGAIGISAGRWGKQRVAQVIFTIVHQIQKCHWRGVPSPHGICRTKRRAERGMSMVIGYICKANPIAIF
jgi:hypothetical protein